MKLYREVKASGVCITYYTPRGYPIHLEPIDITDIEEAYYKHGLSVPNHEERAFTLAEFKEAVLSAKGITEEWIEKELNDRFPYGIAEHAYIDVAEMILSKLKGDE